MAMDDVPKNIENIGLHTGHRSRLRRRYLLEGLEAFQEHEVLELLLFHVLPRRDTNRIAHLIFQRFGSLSAALEANPEDLAAIPGMGEQSAVFLAMIPALTRRYLADRSKRNKIPLSASFRAKDYAIAMFAGRTEEVFYVLCLDVRCQLLFAALIAHGTIRGTYVHPRQVVEVVLRYKAASVILVHNHPAGGLTPSKEDIQLTVTLAQALIPIGVRINDHLIVAGDECVSMADRGDLDGVFYQPESRVAEPEQD